LIFLGLFCFGSFLWAFGISFFHVLLLFRYAFRFHLNICNPSCLLPDAQFMEGLCLLTHGSICDFLLHVIDFFFLFSLVLHRVNCFVFTLFTFITFWISEPFKKLAVFVWLAILLNLKSI
jgi:hypothetical protein